MGISPEMINILARGTGLYTTLVRITALPTRGGDVLAYALGTRKVDFDGSEFVPAPFEPSKMQSTSGTQPTNATITHILEGLITRLNIRGGKWTGARIELMAVDLLNLSAGYARKHNGRIGDVTAGGDQAESQYRGLMQILNQEIGERTSRLCRADLGGFGCFKDLTAYTFNTVVVTVHNNQRVTVALSKPDHFFRYGKAIWTGGLNDGWEMEVLDNDGQMVSLYAPMPYEINIGDPVRLIQGDDKTLYTCYHDFDNAINFQGEPDNPKQEDVYRFPNT